MAVVLHTDLPWPVKRGKVRDVYDLGDKLLIVATDRVSAFDVVMSEGIPEKGKILTALSRFWFDEFAGRFENHLISTDVDVYPHATRPFVDLLRGRSMLVKKAEVIPFECVARGYLVGSGWKDYQTTGAVCGIALPKGLTLCERLPSPIFTPATKAASGHDQNVSLSEMFDVLGPLADDLQNRTLSLYTAAAAIAIKRGIILADTKLEFGLFEGRVILIDEVLTPDSSRFWPADGYRPGSDQPSFDKQFLRSWLESNTWDKTPPPPRLPPEVVRGTQERYLEAYSRLIGRPFEAS